MECKWNRRTKIADCFQISRGSFHWIGGPPGGPLLALSSSRSAIHLNESTTHAHNYLDGWLIMDFPNQINFLWNYSIKLFVFIYITFFEEAATWGDDDELFQEEGRKEMENKLESLSIEFHSPPPLLPRPQRTLMERQTECAVHLKGRWSRFGGFLAEANRSDAGQIRPTKTDRWHFWMIKRQNSKRCATSQLCFTCSHRRRHPGPILLWPGVMMARFIFTLITIINNMLFHIGERRQSRVQMKWRRPLQRARLPIIGFLHVFKRAWSMREL